MGVLKRIAMGVGIFCTAFVALGLIAGFMDLGKQNSSSPATAPASVSPTTTPAPTVSPEPTVADERRAEYLEFDKRYKEITEQCDAATKTARDDGASLAADHAELIPNVMYADFDAAAAACKKAAWGIHEVARPKHLDVTAFDHMKSYCGAFYGAEFATWSTSEDQSVPLSERTAVMSKFIAIGNVMVRKCAEAKASLEDS